MPEPLSLIDQAERQCLARGVRFTPIRRRVLEMIATSHGALKAYDLLDQLAKEHGAARPPTIYRALDFLLEQGLVHRIESLNAYLACHCPEHQHGFQLLICRGCGRVEEMHDDDLGTRLVASADRHGFSIERQTIELEGRCQDCTSQAAAMAENAQ
ncbi:Fur family transcriptional regulator [Cobetia amphilecti]|jgi:Fur family zinc uptake transcriptional regulator|uniref:Ferric uptake regulation protein n=1 Tax=Cobetia amphilecti TaxID=1055104 RepID=A0AAP4WW39_9GAMM|nr:MULTISPECIES: transcriptional repressor [Cobetia]AVV32648.1 transcriptional repressor [Halomonas sp. SF2003]MBR9754566.1 transcriptional repressor [Gammaproteobacteria bacterium]TCJ26081.1 transcriptional repressor [Halomonas sp. GDM18]UTV88223.1 transcriptional repressor [Cobetia litoralis]KGA01834.1 transcriptional regulator [Cobetia amphilecti]|tara:strand:+ start:744 stop:1211 length:468 start_codon:yes stop_codon:yes gene_type:complete